MWVKVAIALVILWWLSRKSEAAAPPPPAPTASVDLGPATVTFHEGSGLWDERWVRPAGTDTGCTFVEGTAGMYDGRYECSADGINWNLPYNQQMVIK